MQPKSCKATPESRATSRLAIQDGTLRDNERVVTILPPARNHVVTGFELFQQPGNVRRVVLPVAVDRDQDLSARQVEGGRQGRRLATVAPQEHNPHVLGVNALNRLELCRRAVGRTVIDKDQLVIDGQRPQYGIELGVKRLDVVDFVEHRNQDG